MEIDINEYEELKMKIMDLEDEVKSLKVENMSLKGENTFWSEQVAKLQEPFIKANVAPEVFDDIFQNLERAELVEIMQQPWDDPLTATIGLKIRYRRKL